MSAIYQWFVLDSRRGHTNRWPLVFVKSPYCRFGVKDGIHTHPSIFFIVGGRTERPKNMGVERGLTSQTIWLARKSGHRDRQTFIFCTSELLSIIKHHRPFLTMASFRWMRRWKRMRSWQLSPPAATWRSRWMTLEGRSPWIAGKSIFCWALGFTTLGFMNGYVGWLIIGIIYWLSWLVDKPLGITGWW